MSEQTRQKIEINGSGSASGGIYQSVVINGAGSIAGDVECVTFTTNGSSTVNGSAKVEKFTTSGTCHIKGNVWSRRLETNGSLKVDGAIMAELIKNSGSTELNGDIRSDDVQSDGYLLVGGDGEIRRFRGKGKFRIRGLLQVDQLDVKLIGRSEAGRIIGRQIQIGKSRLDWFASIFNSNRFRLSVEIIEGDKIQLESTKAAVVRGNQVSIGSGCEVDLVEVAGDYQVASDAIVKEVRRVG